MNEVLTFAGVVREAGAVEAGIDWNRVIVIGGVVYVIAKKAWPYVWPLIEKYIVGPYVFAPLASLVDTLAKYRS